MDLFKSLTNGAKFSKQKHQGTMDLFKGIAGSTESKVKLDLFDAGTSAASSSSSNKTGKSSGREEHQSSLADAPEDEINAFRNRLHIKVKGESIVNPCAEFHEMDLGKESKKTILKNIEDSHWKEPTPIQMQAIPVILANRDILACAPTGSGKTAAYVIPTLSKLVKPMNNDHGIRALLLAPTKELADQIFREVNRLGEGKRFRVCNLKKNVMSQAMNTQGKTTLNKYDILIATPLRLVSLIRAQVVDLSKVEIIVLDEADKLLDIDGRKNDNDDATVPEEEQDEIMEEEKDKNAEEQEAAQKPKRIRSAFLNQVDEIISECPSSTDSSIQLQRCLFSATMGPFVRELADDFLQNPVQVSIGIENAGAKTINQKLVFVGREDGKLLAIRQLIQEGLKPPVLLFVQSIERAQELFRELVYDGINVDIMHSNRSSTQREEVMRRFRLGEVWVLICTDLMARGIDFQGVQMVVNYDLPNTAVNYIHRIGRTGRAGRTGEAVTFFTEEDIPRLRPIANVVKLSGCPVPDWMMTIKAMSTKKKKELKRSAPKRRRIAIESPEEPEAARVQQAPKKKVPMKMVSYTQVPVETHEP